MAFADLPLSVQNIVMVRFELFAKLFILFILFSACLYAINRKQEYSPYIIVAIIRTVTKSLSYMMLIISPLSVIFLYPTVDVSVMLQFMFMFYIVAFFVMLVVFVLNIFYLGPLLMMRFGGYNPDEKRTSAISNGPT